jgi:hypothetical protein
MKTLVEAPNRLLYAYWLALSGRDGNDYPYLDAAAVLKDWHGPIIVLNGGSLDPHIRSMVNHPSRAGNVTKRTV